MPERWQPLRTKTSDPCVWYGFQTEEFTRMYKVTCCTVPEVRISECMFSCLSKE